MRARSTRVGVRERLDLSLLEEYLNSKRKHGVDEDSIVDDDSIGGRVHTRRVQWRERRREAATSLRVWLHIDMEASILVEMTVFQEAAEQGLESTRQCIKRVAEELHTHGRQAAWRLILTGYSQMMSSEKRIMISTRNRWALVQERSLSSWVVCNTWFFFACTRSCAMVCCKRTARGSTEQNSAANVAVLSAGPWK